MKKYSLLPVLALFFLGFLLSCNHDDDDTLPAATQTGAGTFGCTVNGKNFVDNSGEFNCFYQFVDGGYYFGIAGDDEKRNPQTIYLLTTNKTISEGETYILKSRTDGNASGSGFFLIGYGETADTNDTYTGQLTITRFDHVKRVVSGTFWFDVQNPITGERIEVREGRFDTLFGT